MRQAVIPLLVLLLVTPTVISGLNAVFVIYGLPTCPYCYYQKEFFNNAKVDCVFIDASVRSQSYYEIVGAAGLEHYVPVTVVVNRDGYVTAVVQGLVSEESFWTGLAQKDPREGVPVYIGGELIRVINETDKINLLNDVVRRDLSELLNQTTVSTEAGVPTTASQQQLFELLKVVALIALVVATLFAASIVMRRAKRP